MDNKKPYPIFREPGILTDDTPVMGIPGKVWDEALLGGFLKNLESGNEILKRLEEERCAGVVQVSAGDV
jgi:hypothetical protein